MYKKYSLRYHSLYALYKWTGFAVLLAGAMALGRLHDDYVIAIFSVCFSLRQMDQFVAR